MNRKEANTKILEQLRAYLLMYPDMRFGQALVNLGIVENVNNPDDYGIITLDPFYEEPEVTLERMKALKNG